MRFKNKKILITAGPTWVPIDSVRVISNIATGQTGILLAQSLQHLGARVTLLLGPGECFGLSDKIKLIRFKFFAELSNIIKKELNSQNYDIVIHSAAVSDYIPAKKYANKVKSGKRAWSLNLVPTPKIIDQIKKIDNTVFLVGFKFEPAANKRILIKKTKSLISCSNLDLAVGNSINKDRYEAYIVRDNLVRGPFLSKKKVAGKLIEVIGDNL